MDRVQGSKSRSTINEDPVMLQRGWMAPRVVERKMVRN